MSVLSYPGWTLMARLPKGRLGGLLATIVVGTVIAGGVSLIPNGPPASSGNCPVATENVPDGPDAFGGCYPGPDTTGPDAAPDWPGSYTAQGQPGCTLPIQSNTTYSFCDFTAGLGIGSSGSEVSNVTFHGVRFKGAAVNDINVVPYTTGTLTFEYCEFAPNDDVPPTTFAQSYQLGIAAAEGSIETMVVDHSDFWGFGNAITIEGTTQAHPATFTDNYIHDASDDNNDTYHTDGIGQLNNGLTDSYVTISHNTIMSAGNTNGLAFQNGTYDHFTVTQNLFSGFGATIAIWASLGSTDIAFTDNVFSTMIQPVFGPMYPQDFWLTAGSTWSGNKWEVPSGAEWGNPAHDGYYWIPDSTLAEPPTDDTPYVSLTDYAG